MSCRHPDTTEVSTFSSVGLSPSLVMSLRPRGSTKCLSDPQQWKAVANSSQEATIRSCPCAPPQSVFTSVWSSQSLVKGRGAEGKGLRGGVHKKCHL